MLLTAKFHSFKLCLKRIIRIVKASYSTYERLFTRSLLARVTNDLGGNKNRIEELKYPNNGEAGKRKEEEGIKSEDIMAPKVA